jgi:hypothetical protein
MPPREVRHANSAEVRIGPCPKPARVPKPRHRSTVVVFCRYAVIEKREGLFVDNGEDNMKILVKLVTQR